MTEKEKMEKGELYDAAIPELIEQLLSTRDKIFELNHLRPSQLEEREKLIREIIGTTPEKFIIISPFFCDYGHNIHLGKNFFANYNCVMPIVAKERRYDYEFFGCSTNDFPNEFFSFF